LLLTFPGWHVEEGSVEGDDVDVRPFPSRAIVNLIGFLLFFATVLSMVGALYQHTTAATLTVLVDSSTAGLISGHVGAGAIALVWLGVILSGVVYTLIKMLQVAMDVFARALEDD
jgi:hypothetical protein